MDIRIDDLSSSAVCRLIREHLQAMAQHSPPESVHALDPDALRKPDITFWSVWQDAELAGCGALKELDALHGEIKSMRTASAHLRKGVATSRRSYRRLSLETGAMDAFAPARRLYTRFGFRPCGPFAHYVDDWHSIFMTIDL